MLTYWLMYLPAAVLAISESARNRQMSWMPWIILGVCFVLFIGFRYQVGGDWGSYLHYYDWLNRASLGDALTRGDPGYAFLNWLMARWDLGIYGVNLVCGAIFMAGLTVFCRQQSRPWLSFAVAVPYLLVVVAMGYTRQGVALGFLFWALASLEKGDFKRYLVFIAAAVLFHKTALLMIPLGIFLYRKGWFLRVVAILMTGYMLWDLLLAEEHERLWRVYVVDQQLVSEGAKIRAWMNLVPSLLLLAYWRRWKELFPNYWFWFILAIGSILNVVLVDFASTAVDRVALYLSPIQVAVFSRLPVLAQRQFPPQLMTVGIVLGYAAVLFVWLNYATHARYWVPYQNMLFQ